MNCEKFWWFATVLFLEGASFYLIYHLSECYADTTACVILLLMQAQLATGGILLFLLAYRTIVVKSLEEVRKAVDQKDK